MENNNNRNKMILTGIVVTLLVVSNLLTYIVATNLSFVFGNKVLIDAQDEATVEGVSKLIALKDQLNESFYKDLDQEALWEGAIKGLFQATGDDYTMYMTEEEYLEYTASFDESYEGIGVQIVGLNDGSIKVEKVFTGSPAIEAGVKAGDIIIEASGNSTEGMTTTEVSNLLRGEKGTIAELSVNRDGSVINFSIERDEIIVETITSKTIEGDIGYINITEFNDGVGDRFQSAYDSLIEDENVKAMIIDLRDNPGGLVNEAEQIANILLEEGDIIYSTLHKDEKIETIIDTTSEYIDIPLVVLVNEYSASSSEILATSIKDNDIGDLVGINTYGKGIIQSFGPLSFGGGSSITIQEYVSPMDTPIHGTGIAPDYEVKNEDDTPISLLEEDDDLQLKKAIEILNNKIK